jgi:hypothetical protein
VIFPQSNASQIELLESRIQEMNSSFLASQSLLDSSEIKIQTLQVEHEKAISELERQHHERYEQLLGELKTLRKRVSTATAQPQLISSNSSSVSSSDKSLNSHNNNTVLSSSSPRPSEAATPSLSNQSLLLSPFNTPAKSTPSLSISATPSSNLDASFVSSSSSSFDGTHTSSSSSDDVLVMELARLQSKRDAEVQRAKSIIQTLRQRLQEGLRFILSPYFFSFHCIFASHIFFLAAHR